MQLLEEKGDWDKAFEVKKRLLKDQFLKNNKILALYKVEAGKKLLNDNKGKEGRIKFREAIRLSKSCAPAYLYLSDSYIEENRLSDALAELKKFVEHVPELAYLAFDRIKDILFQVGNFGEIESIYTNLLKNNPDIIPIRFALADIYERKGEIDKAIDLCIEELDKNPESIIAKKYLVKFYTKTDRQNEALNISIDLINLSLSEENQFICNVCGHNSNQPLWYCPVCYEWNSYLE